MSSLTMVEAKLPPGFRFHPRDDELVCDYLMKKLDGCDSPLLIEVDLNKCEPWDIPEIACVGGKEWYFYNQRDRKYATGLRTNRATATGYWKATGKDRPVDRRGNLVGMRKTLVFYQGRAPKGKKTEWVMHEFRIEGPFAPPKIPTCNSKQEDWVLCRVFYKNRSNDASSSPKSAENDSISMEETSSSSGLPPLMDSYITFDQTHVNAYQQVPCFSITSSSSSSPNLNNNTYNHHHHFNPNPNYPNPNPNPIFSHNFHMHDNPSHENHAITKDHHHQTFGGNMMPNYNNDSPTNNNNLISPLTCGSKVLEVVLTHLTKMETSPNTNDISSSSFGEVASSQTFNDNNLSSHIALPPHHMWNQF